MMERVFTSDGFDIHRPLYRYMPLTYFLNMLETKKFRVSQRKIFTDALESGLDIKRQFRPVYVGDRVPKQDKASLQKDPDILLLKSTDHKRYSELLTSCWTTQDEENMLMWDCYAQKLGVRIQSDGNSFISAIDCKDNDCLCAAVTYERDNWNHTAEDILFVKHPAYRNEEEVRFYFANIDEEKGLIDPIEDDSIKEQKGKNFPINIKGFIKSVTLSPFIERCVARKLADWIKRDYDIEVKPSSVSINNH